jgi:hypothetical protein
VIDELGVPLSCEGDAVDLDAVGFSVCHTLGSSLDELAKQALQSSAPVVHNITVSHDITNLVNFVYFQVSLSAGTRFDKGLNRRCR